MFIILPLSLLRDIETLNVMSTVSVAMYMLLVLKVCTLFPFLIMLYASF